MHDSSPPRQTRSECTQLRTTNTPGARENGEHALPSLMSRAVVVGLQSIAGIRGMLSAGREDLLLLKNPWQIEAGPPLSGTCPVDFIAGGGAWRAASSLVLRRSIRLVSPVEGCPARCKRILTARNESGMEGSFTLALKSVSGSCPGCGSSCRARRFFVAVPGVPNRPALSDSFKFAIASMSVGTWHAKPLECVFFELSPRDVSPGEL